MKMIPLTIQEEAAIFYAERRAAKSRARAQRARKTRADMDDLRRELKRVKR